MGYTIISKNGLAVKILEILNKYTSFLIKCVLIYNLTISIIRVVVLSGGTIWIITITAIKADREAVRDPRIRIP